MKPIAYTAAAAKALSKLPADIARRLVAKLDRYAATGAGDVTKLVGEGRIRLRVGDFRAVFVETETEIRIVAIGHRREIYR